jgi:hypothetical protein
LTKIPLDSTNFRTSRNIFPVPPGYEWHRIVPQHDDNIKAFGDLAINSTSNLVLLKKKEYHDPITYDFYNAKLEDTGDLTLREFLKPKTFDEQHAEGVKILLERGHFPCGWKGRFPKGKLIIY